MNETILSIILCTVASLLVIIICNYNKCKHRFNFCHKKSKGITIDEMKIIIDDLDEFKNKNNKKSDENELL